MNENGEWEANAKLASEDNRVALGKFHEFRAQAVQGAPEQGLHEGPELRPVE
jgi:hypothetical protein